MSRIPPTWGYQVEHARRHDRRDEILSFLVVCAGAGAMLLVAYALTVYILITFG